MGAVKDLINWKKKKEKAKSSIFHKNNKRQRHGLSKDQREKYWNNETELMRKQARKEKNKLNKESCNTLTLIRQPLSKSSKKNYSYQTWKSKGQMMNINASMKKKQSHVLSQHLIDNNMKEVSFLEKTKTSWLNHHGK
jgi:hypothetical protein